MNSRNTTYLMDEPHWRVLGVRDLGRFFVAATLLPTNSGVLCLADGAWPSNVQELLSRIEIHRDSSPHPGKGCESRRSRHVPLTAANARALAQVAEHCAEPEIGIHFAVFDGATVLLEWFDAVSDSIALSGALDEGVVQRFADAAQGRCARVGRGNCPSG